MTNELSILQKIGFVRAGRWTLSSFGLELELDPILSSQQNALYAFVTNGSLAYIGKTARALKERMQRYKTPASSAERGGSTNIKNNREIINVLSKGGCVDIYAFIDPAQHSHVGFAVNLAAGLEDVLIKKLAPPWNGRRLATYNVTAIGAQASPIKVIDDTFVMKKEGTSEVNKSNNIAPKAVHGYTIKYNQQSNSEHRLTKIDFEKMLYKILTEARTEGHSYIDIRSGNLHTEVGGYPGRGHSMPTCCATMYDAMKPGDEVLQAPPKGKGANLVIRYRLARQ